MAGRLTKSPFMDPTIRELELEHVSTAPSFLILTTSEGYEQRFRATLQNAIQFVELISRLRQPVTSQDLALRSF